MSTSFAFVGPALNPAPYNFLSQELARLRKIPTFRDTHACRARLRLSPSPGGEARQDGQALPQIHLPDRPLRRNQAQALLLHEMVHVSGCWRHDARFARRLLRAAEEAYGVPQREARLRSRRGLDAAMYADSYVESRLRFPRLGRSRAFRWFFRMFLHTWTPTTVRPPRSAL